MTENLVVREQLHDTIVRKQRQINSLTKRENELREEMAKLKKQRLATTAEVKELASHLDSIGGPPENAIKG